jgi:hypothetical protein
MKPNRNKPNDYRNWSPAALDAAIMYEIENCRCTQRLDHLLAARNYKGAWAMKDALAMLALFTCLAILAII